MGAFTDTYAPGWPGSDPRWNSSAKSGVGVSLSPLSQVWFTTSHGILNEIYYPRVDYACIRDMGFLVSDGKDFFSEEKRHASSCLEYLEDGVPAYRFTNTCNEGRYRIEKEILTDPSRDTLLQQIRFVPLEGAVTDYHLYALMAPHIMNAGAGNNAWCDEYKGLPMIFAERENTAVAMACSIPFTARSVGFVGRSDAWQDISRNKQMTWRYQRAENGNVAMCGEIDLAAATDVPFVVAIGFGMNADEAGQRALASILDGFDYAKQGYMEAWRNWQQTVEDYSYPRKDNRSLFRISAATIQSHHAQQFPGGYIASLSVPWGFSKGDDDLGGYHLIWPRDLVEIAGGLLAAGATHASLSVLHYLRLAQEPDGHWLQNMWLDGSGYWEGVQLDETALPILLTNMLFHHGVLDKQGLEAFLPMVRRAVQFLVKSGPCSEQDRWEENAGYSPFTLSALVAALLAAADMLALFGEKQTAAYLRETADTWNDNIEPWTYVTGTELARQLDIEGYYVRIAPPNVGETPTLEDDVILIKNIAYQADMLSEKIVSPDALALVRFGLRRADDPRILNTVKAIDSLLKVETPMGELWHRYNHDGYGEHADGSPFNGTGIGRGWPLLTGERAHYELAAGNKERAAKLLGDMGNFSNEGGMIPEQIWDAEDIPEKELFFGKPAGSAMPLVWAHSEYMKICRSMHDGAVFDTPIQTRQRYLVQDKHSTLDFWRFSRKLTTVTRRKKLRIEALAPFSLHWTKDDWASATDTQSRDTGIGVHLVDIPLSRLKAGSLIRFTFLWTGTGNWEGKDFQIEVVK
jgi:glucoamylase